MKRGTIFFKNGNYINVPADTIIRKDNEYIMLVNKCDIVAIAKLDFADAVYISEEREEEK